MDVMHGRTRLLPGILAFAGLLAVWAWIGPRSGERASAVVETAPPARAAAARPPVDHVEELRFAALGAPRREHVPGRDPWRFVTVSQPGRTSTPAVVRPRPEPAALIAPPPSAHAAAAEPPRFPWTYLGSFGPADRRIAVFADGSEVHNRREGEVLAGRFVLERIGIESVDVRPLDTPGAPAERLAPGAGRGRGMA